MTGPRVATVRTGYHRIMEHAAPRRRAENRTEPTEHQTHLLRRIAIAAGLGLVVLILVGVAIYAAAFIMLAPMMQ
ncbi:hypothetical protein [Mycolicibacterium thermoresistibile]